MRSLSIKARFLLLLLHVHAIASFRCFQHQVLTRSRSLVSVCDVAAYTSRALRVSIFEIGVFSNRFMQVGELLPEFACRFLRRFLFCQPVSSRFGCLAAHCFFPREVTFACRLRARFDALAAIFVCLTNRMLKCSRARVCWCFCSGPLVPPWLAQSSLPSHQVSSIRVLVRVRMRGRVPATAILDLLRSIVEPFAAFLGDICMICDG